MATKMTQKDKTLHEIIDWCIAKKESCRDDHFNNSNYWGIDGGIDEIELSYLCDACIEELDAVIEHCKNMLN